MVSRRRHRIGVTGQTLDGEHVDAGREQLVALDRPPRGQGLGSDVGDVGRAGVGLGVRLP
jgi:hypothetical protein